MIQYTHTEVNQSTFVMVTPACFVSLDDVPDAARLRATAPLRVVGTTENQVQLGRQLLDKTDLHLR